MALRRREQAASPQCLVSPAVGEVALLHTVPTLEHRVAELEVENRDLRAENRLLRALLSADAPQDPKGTATTEDW